MKRIRIKSLAIFGLVAFFLIIGCTVWIAIRVVDGVGNLNLSVQIDNEQIQSFITEAVRLTLRDGNETSQTDMLEQLRTAATDLPGSKTWIEKEFLIEIQDLSGAPNEKVADSADNLLQVIETIGPEQQLGPSEPDALRPCG